MISIPNNKAIVAGNAANHYPKWKVLFLPTDHYDFIGPLDVKGKTEEQINNESRFMMRKL